MEFDKNIEGPVTNLVVDADGTSMTFEVLGRQVTATKTGTYFEDVTFDTLADNNVVEVSGLADSSGNLTAVTLRKRPIPLPSAIPKLKSAKQLLNVTGTGTVGDSFEINSIDQHRS